MEVFRSGVHSSKSFSNMKLSYIYVNIVVEARRQNIFTIAFEKANGTHSYTTRYSLRNSVIITQTKTETYT